MSDKVMSGCEVSAERLAEALPGLRKFMERFIPCFGRRDTAANAERIVQGLLSDLPRKSVEPIAELHGVKRRALQFFVGESPWSDDLVIEALQRDVVERWGDPNGVLVLDPTTFPKTGEDSVGVARQWCGRLGKVDNCQKGVFAAYVTARGAVLVEGEVYLPEDWIDDATRRAKCYVPAEVEFKTSWEIGADLVDWCSRIPHAFVVGDDEFGRAAEFRDLLRHRHERYLLNVPANTLVRSRGGKWMNVSDWASSRGSGSWYRCLVRDGSRGPIYVDAIAADVQTKRDGCNGPWERVLVTKSVEKKPRTSYSLTNASRDVAIGELVRTAGARHGIEEVFERAKGHVGLADYELRSWIGWHHHVTLAMLALWFLELERERLGGENTGHHTSPGRLRNPRAPSQPRAGSRSTRTEDHGTPVTKRGGAGRSMATRRPTSARTRRGSKADSGE